MKTVDQLMVFDLTSNGLKMCLAHENKKKFEIQILGEN